MLSKDTELARIYAMHALTAWNAFGTYSGEILRTTQDRFRTKEVTRPRSVRNYKDSTGVEGIVDLLRVRGTRFTGRASYSIMQPFAVQLS